MCVCISHIYCAPVNLSLFPFSLHKSFFFFLEFITLRRLLSSSSTLQTDQNILILHFFAFPLALGISFSSPLSPSFCTALEVIASLIRARFMLH